MTPVRALIAGLLAAVIFAAGLFIAANAAEARPHDLVPLLSIGRTPFSVWCFLAAWGAVGFGVLGVLSAFLAFVAPEEEEDPRFRRRGFPKALPPFLIALALGLAYLALACGPKSGDEPPIAVPVPPAPDLGPPSPTKLSGEEDPLPEPPPQIEPVGVAAASFQWRYMDPRVSDGRAFWTGGSEPFADGAETRALLCGKDWIAVTGSASQEGPAERNAARARRRTERAMKNAASYIYNRDDCGGAHVFGVDLGQHVPTGVSLDDAGAATAYQRQVLVASRARGGASMSVDAAEADLRAFLSDPAGRAALLAGREFAAEPDIIRP